MDLTLDYGRTGLPVSLPNGANITVLHPAYVPALPVRRRPWRRAARPHRLGSCASAWRRMTVAIVFSDITRPTPNHLLIPASWLSCPVPPENIVLCNAGHPPLQYPRRLIEVLGEAIVDGYRIEQNGASTRHPGLPGDQLTRARNLINRVYMEASVKI